MTWVLAGLFAVAFWGGFFLLLAKVKPPPPNRCPGCGAVVGRLHLGGCVFMARDGIHRCTVAEAATTVADLFPPPPPPAVRKPPGYTRVP